MKRLLTFVLSVGFFIWLPNAFADDGGLSLDSPATFRQVQVGPEGGSPLLTLRVDNIQVREYWEVKDVHDVFDIDQKGVLKVTVDATDTPTDTHVATVFAVDQFDLLNDDYVNLTASAVITVVFLSGEVRLPQVPRLIAVAEEAVNLYTFAAIGGDDPKTYTLLAGDGRYFSVGADSGVLSLSASVEVGEYTLTVQATDAKDKTAQATVTVGVSAVLSMADAPLISVALGEAVSLHTFAASGGIGIKTYTLLADDEKYFSVNADSGVLYLLADAQKGVYTLTVQAIDKRNRGVDALATVRVSAALSLADAPPFTVIASMAMSLHTFVASAGIGVKTYTLLDGDENYFSVDADSGVLSLSMNTPAREYILIVQAKDEHANTVQAVATVGVSAVLSLADAKSLGGAQGIEISLHTFVAQGGIGARTYTLLTDDVEDYFSLDAESGVLFLLTAAPVNTYTLSVQVKDERGNTADALATVGVVFLFLSEVPRLYAIVGREVNLHTFDAKGVIGTLTYTITAGDDKDYFSLDTASGALAVRSTATIGIYTLSVSVKDGRSSAKAVAVVEVRASLSLAVVPPLTVIVGRVAHTLSASGGIGAPTYTIEDGAKVNFALDAASGVLSLSMNAEAGKYTLMVLVMDERNNTVQAVVTVGVSAVLSLADVPRFTVIASMAMSLHTFVASGGIGVKTYTLVVGDENYFSVDADSGVLSLSLNTPAGEYMLIVQVMDSRNNTAETVAMVGVSAALSLADAPPPFTVIASMAMSLHTFVASGGIGVKTYILQAGDGGRYFSIGVDSGVLSLSVKAPAKEYTLTVKVRDARNNTVETVATVEVSAALVLADAPPFTVIASVAMSLHTFAATGGIGVKTYTLLAGDDERYFAVGVDSGVLSLSLNAPAKEYRLTVQAIDEQNNIAQVVVMVGVSATLALADAPPLTVIASVAMSLHTFAANGGIGVKTYTLLASDGVEYFTLDAASGVLSLTVSAPIREYTLTVQATDGQNNTVQAVATVEVSTALVLADDAPRFTVIASVAMSLHTFAASGGIGIKTYTLRAGDGVEYFSVGVDSGVLSLSVNTPAKEYTLTVQAIDEQNNIAQVVATVGVSAVLALADVPSFTVIASLAMSLHTFAASGGIGVKTYTLRAGDGVEYFTLDAASGVLSLTVNAPIREYTLTVQATDEQNSTVQAVATVEVAATLVLADVPPFTVIASVAMSLHTFAASGGVGVKTYTLRAGDGVEYFSVNATSGVLSLSVNTPAKEYTLTVQAADEQNNITQAVATVGVSAVLALADVPSFTVIAVAMSLHTFAASGGIGVKTYTLRAGDGGAYFSVNAASGVLSLSVNAPIREYTLTVLATDEENNTAQAVATVVVSAALLLADAPSFTVIASVAMSLHTFAASGGVGIKTYTLRAGDDEGYFSVNATSGVLSLSANAPAKEYRLKVQAIDEQNNIAQVLVTVGVSTVLSLADALLTVIAVAKGVHTFAASGGIGAKTYTLLAGDGGEYFSVDAASGVLSLSANVETGRKYTLTVQVMDERKVTVQALATVEVSAALVLVKASLLVVKNGVVMSLHTFAASGGVGVKTYIIAAGNGAGYFVIDSASGVLSVTNAVANFYILSVKVSDSQGNYAQVGSTVEVWGPLLLADAPPLETFARLSAAVVLHTFAASGGLGAKRYTMIADDGSGYFAVGADSGELLLPSNSDMRAGTYNLLVEASDSLSPPQRATVAATVRIVKNGIFVMAGHASYGPVGNRNDVWSSLDGEVWRRQTGNAGWPVRTRGEAVSHNGLLYVLGGYDGDRARKNDVWSSADGRNWTLKSNAPWEGREQFQAVSHNGRLHVLSGSSGSMGNAYRRDAWSSDDGETWVLDSNKAWGGGGTRRGLGAVSHNGRLYVMGGHRNGTYRDVWSSVDGKGTWSFEGNAEWPSRAHFDVVSHNGRMYVIGGDSDGNLTPIGDVWSSADGKNWVQEKENTEAYWGKRYRLRAVSHNGLLYVVGGRYEAVGSDLNARDVWSSADGKSWTIVVDNVQSLGRSGFAAAVFPPPLVLWGVGEAIMLNAGVANTEIHKFTAQYGVGQYTYELLTDVTGFSVDGSSGVLSANSSVTAGSYTLTVQVKDEEETEAETAVKINVVASSTAALSAGSSGISPPASGGGASAKALAGGGISLDIIAPPASSLSRPRTPPTSAGGENIGEIPV